MWMIKARYPERGSSPGRLIYRELQRIEIGNGNNLLPAINGLTKYDIERFEDAFYILCFFLTFRS